MELVPAQYYEGIYNIIMAIISIIVMEKYAQFSGNRIMYAPNENVFNVIMFALITALLIGFRPLSGLYFVDMKNYHDIYMSLLWDKPFHWDWDTTNKLFDNIIAWFGSNCFDEYAFFVSIAIVYFLCMAIACSILFPKDKMSSFLVCLMAFSTFSFGTNGIKAGAAASLFLVALAFNDKGQKIGTIVFILLSWGFHHSMQLPVAAFVACKIVKNPKYYLWFWCFCFLMALGHITFFMGIFEGMTDEGGAEYLNAAGETYKGFRLDFVLYSAAPIIIGYIALTKKFIVSKKYEFLLNLYTFTNSIWLLCMYAEFTNRISYLSWFMLPIVLIYPFLRENWGSNQYVIFKKVVYGHMFFSLFMFFVYYGFIHELLVSIR